MTYLVTGLGVRILAVLFLGPPHSPMTMGLIHPVVHRSEEVCGMASNPVHWSFFVEGSVFMSNLVVPLSLMVKVGVHDHMKMVHV